MIREEISMDNFEFPFVIYRPTEMKDTLPLVVQLHGAGEVGNGGDELYKVDINGLSHLMTDDIEYPALFVLPQCPKDSFWVAEIQKIHSFISKIIQKYNVDERRIYLTGLSMGGYGTWYTALRYPEMFAAIAPVCGGGMMWRADVLDMPVWAFHGTEDTVVYPTETENMIKAICCDTHKKDVKMTMFDGVGHNSWEYAYAPELIEWLLSKSR